MSNVVQTVKTASVKPGDSSSQGPGSAAGPPDKAKASSRRSPRMTVRWLFAGASVLTFLLATLIAHFQPLPLIPVSDTSLSDTAWWLHPHEENAHRRLISANTLLEDVFVLPDGKHAWVVGRHGEIWASNDGGSVWGRQESGVKIHLLSVHFVDAQRGWAVGTYGVILATYDGGENWQRQESGIDTEVRSVHFVDVQHGWAVGNAGVILVTSDGGENWQRQVLGTEHESGIEQISGGEQRSIGAVALTSVHFVDALRGWAVGDEGVILATSDGGENWRRQEAGTEALLHSVHFVDSQHGWAVGEDEVILVTSNGGESWRRQKSGLEQRSSRVVGLESVHFADLQRGWAVGSRGVILATSDGGENWRLQESGSTRALVSVHFVDSRRGWAVGSGGFILATSDAGESWRLRESDAPKLLMSVHFVDAQHGWAVGSGGFILSTSDAGKNWRRQESGTEVVLASVHFVNAQRGWAVGEDEGILVTSNGGESWRRQKSGLEQRSGRVVGLLSVHFVDALHGWVVGYDGVILATYDGGENWRPQESGTEILLHSVHFVDAQRGWAVGAFGFILATFDGGENWRPQDLGTEMWLHSVCFVDAQRGWAVGASGVILATFDGGENWRPRESSTEEVLLSVHFVNAQRGWIVGSNGVILATFDGGESWRPQQSGTKTALRSVHFVDAQHGWTVGENGVILSTKDAGQTWTQQRQHRRSPAPWYYVACLLSLALLAPTLRQPPTIEIGAESVEDRAYSDRPIRPGDPDPLDFGVVARGIANFLTNPSTAAPLTLAVAGRWGSGKSSLMNLVQGDLEQRGFRPVWFNAWHHQKEEHLLAALLEAIRLSAAPAWLHREGLRYRAKLLWKRSKRRWIRTALVLAAFGGSVGYYWNRVDQIGAAAEMVRAAIAMDDEQGQKQESQSGAGAKPKTSSAPTSPSAPIADDSADKSRRRHAAARVDGFDDKNTDGHPIFGLLALLATLVATVAALIGNLRSFGIDPSKLLAGASSNARLSDLRIQIGLRPRFAAEFKDVTEALKPRRLVIFIDDLDRCRPENVMELLEAVNFLTSCGDCFVILGIDRDQVQRAVGLACKDVAEEMLDEELSDGAAPSDSRMRQAVYARQYLEKLINVELDVPVPSNEESVRLFEADRGSVETKWQTIWSELRIFGPFLLALSILICGFVIGRRAAPDKRELAREHTIVFEEKLSKSDDGGDIRPEPVDLETDAEQPPTSQPAPSTQPSAKAPPPISPFNLSLWWLLGLGPLAAFALWRLTRPADEIETDSPNFLSAMDAVHPLLHVSPRNTPRSIKRFANRVRFMAMRMRAEPPDPEAAPLTGVSDEEVLVFLAAAEHYDPALPPGGILDRIYEVKEAVEPRTKRFDPLIDLAIRISRSEGVDRFHDRYRRLSASFRM